MSHRKQSGCALRLAVLPLTVLLIILRTHRRRG